MTKQTKNNNKFETWINGVSLESKNASPQKNLNIIFDQDSIDNHKINIIYPHFRKSINSNSIQSKSKLAILIINFE